MAAYTRISPANHGTKVTAATLFPRAEDDKRAPISCSEIMCLMLKRRGVETQFVRYPSGDHGFGEAHPYYTPAFPSRTAPKLSSPRLHSAA
jgi:dipeptidyl aminopeptidase/acylaminoacyl peptidase